MRKEISLRLDWKVAIRSQIKSSDRARRALKSQCRCTTMSLKYPSITQGKIKRVPPQKSRPSGVKVTSIFGTAALVSNPCRSQPWVN
ncbi:Wiskott-Aldrich syndrome protein [Fusarium oxysporum f. sp. albedinis]|nr:Wiskott-Aldrich syndrome protein [Fusarium oxysporum f. sp. albedinis]